MIEACGLENRVKDWSLLIFRRLAEAEAKVHGVEPEDVHFHEVGAVDSIVDIVGSCIGFDYFDVESFFSAPLALGGGVVTFSHGTWPVPAPATAELVRGFPTRLGPVEAELTTPTGAAIITSLVEKGTAPPVCEFDRFGFGAGDRQFDEIPNMLRLMLGRPGRQTDASAGGEDEEMAVLEASIDDMDPELLGHFLELALSQGALDVYYGSLHMKKNRPGVLLTLLCRPQDRDRMMELVFRETTTLGVRWSSWRRRALARELRSVETEFGPVTLKVARLGGQVVNVWPEFEDLRRISRERRIPLKELRRRILIQVESQDL